MTQLTSKILIGATPETLLFGLGVAAVVVVVLLVAVAVIAIMLLRRSSETPHDPAVDDLARRQGGRADRMQVMGEALARRQAELARVLSDRLDSVSSRLGASLDSNTKHTGDRLQNLHERLAVIENAQKT